MAKKKTSVKLSRFTVDYISDRRAALMAEVGDRNTEMDRYESMYRLDVWESEKPPDEQRVTLPLAFDVVEKLRALVFARPPQFSVPPTGNGVTERSRAQKLERYVYAVADRTNLYNLSSLAEWYACCLGRGWLKATYDAQATDDEYPVIIVTPDPRTIYARPNARKDGLSELVHTYERSRRSIQDEWDIELPDAPSNEDQLDGWLDEPTCYTEYWTAETAWETKAEEDADEEDLKPKGVIEMAAEHMMSTTIAAKAPPPMDATGQAMPTIGDYIEAQPESEKPAPTDDLGTGAEKPQRIRVRKIVHAIVAGEGDEAVYIKKPVVMVGYKVIPFFGWSGIETPLEGGKDYLSVLFALTAGDGSKNASGVLQAYNLVASLYLDEAVRRTHAPLMTDDPLAEVDISPDSINVVGPGKNIQFLQPPPVNNSLQVAGDMMSKMIDRVATPEVLNGQVFSLSGQAISGLANAFQMMIAFKQHEREMALRKMFEHILCLTSHYSGEDGWRAYGTGAYGRFVEEAVTSGDIGDQYRVIVKLSSSLPKDEIAQTNLFAQLLQNNAISWETFLDQFQKMWGLAADSPEDEIQRTFAYMMLRDKGFAADMAKAKADDYIALMKGLSEGTSLAEIQRAERLRYLNPPPPTPPTPPPPPPGVPGGGPQQQMPGLPSSSVPPNPQGVAASGNLAGAQAMPGLLQTGGQ